jgi:hypothetical protein
VKKQGWQSKVLAKPEQSCCIRYAGFSLMFGRSDQAAMIGMPLQCAQRANADYAKANTNSLHSKKVPIGMA